MNTYFHDPQHLQDLQDKHSDKSPLYPGNNGVRPLRRQTEIHLLHYVDKQNSCNCPLRRQSVFHEAWPGCDFN